jgi:putative oxidoreductase
MHPAVLHMISVRTSATTQQCANLFNSQPEETLLRYLDRLQPLALLVLRIVIGTIMIAHGYGKVFGGFSHVRDMVQHIGFPTWTAYLLAGTEFFGGILILAGLLTRFVAVAMLIDMSVAIWKIHWHNGLKGPGAVEFPLAVAAIAFSLIFLGAGPIALDSVRKGGGGRKAKSNRALGSRV